MSITTGDKRPSRRLKGDRGLFDEMLHGLFPEMPLGEGMALRYCAMI
jgi:hypothetical protein